jgi:hypothetical protein|mmetsp:Transcript_66770/g.149016  ORF Transcript_66770/g.149016 Transcript_66770/m.149016 type:complete len:88 (-) Transcript_66770:444-707(-)
MIATLTGTSTTRSLLVRSLAEPTGSTSPSDNEQSDELVTESDAATLDDARALQVAIGDILAEAKADGAPAAMVGGGMSSSDWEAPPT